MPSDFDRMRRLSRRMRMAVGAGGLALAAGAAAFLASPLFAPQTFQNLAAQAVGGSETYVFTPSATAMLIVLFAIQLGILLYAIWCIWRMLGELSGDEPLSREAALWMHRGSFGFLAAAAASFLATPVATVALTFANPPGQRAVALSLGSTDLLALLIAAIMFMTSHILALAAEIRDDQRAIV
jgi:magnesium-transporting ATPase (P-type)